MAMNNVLVYHLYPLAWGSFRMLTLFLTRLKALDVDYIWLSPVYQSPRRNGGYDVSDYYDIDPTYGDMEDFDEFVRTAHLLGMKVIMDLPIDSTSIEHVWFHTDDSRYVWAPSLNMNWQNLFDHDTAWRYDRRTSKYYLHLNHQSQADLNWFNSGIINRPLVDCFKAIMEYWLYERDIDGFRLGSIQTINKNILQQEMKFKDLLVGNQAVAVLNNLANIYGGKNPFILADVIDPQYSDVVEYYAEKTDVEFISNSILKSTITKHTSLNTLKKRIGEHVKNPRFALELESHDSPRFTSRSGLSGKEVIDLMFSSGASAVILNQGQELGLENPANLDLEEMVKLDAKVITQLERHASIESIRQNSRANTRVPLPLDEYIKQELDENSTLSHTKNAIQKWRSL